MLDSNRGRRQAAILSTMPLTTHVSIVPRAASSPKTHQTICGTEPAPGGRQWRVTNVMRSDCDPCVPFHGAQAQALAVAAGDGVWADLPPQYLKLVRNVWKDRSARAPDARK